VRAHGDEVPAWARVDDDEPEVVHVRLDARLRGVAPGQSVVLYDGTRVVGSATIASTDRSARGIVEHSMTLNGSG
jgi:tRNA-specific 2-thiouridylase